MKMLENMFTRVAACAVILLCALSCASDEEVQEVLPRSISISPAELSVQVGDTSRVEVSLSPTTTTNKDIIWSSTDTIRVVVDGDGNVVALSQGTAYVVAKTVNALVASCLVTVAPADMDTDTEAGTDPAPGPGPEPDVPPVTTPEDTSVEIYIEEDVSDRYSK
jgi:uncharacterized protein YabE (DUF348 family)